MQHARALLSLPSRRGEKGTMDRSESLPRPDRIPIGNSLDNGVCPPCKPPPASKSPDIEKRRPPFGREERPKAGALTKTNTQRARLCGPLMLQKGRLAACEDRTTGRERGAGITLTPWTWECRLGGTRAKTKFFAWTKIRRPPPVERNRNGGLERPTHRGLGCVLPFGHAQAKGLSVEVRTSRTGRERPPSLSHS